MTAALREAGAGMSARPPEASQEAGTSPTTPPAPSSPSGSVPAAGDFGGECVAHERAGCWCLICSNDSAFVENMVGYRARVAQGHRCGTCGGQADGPWVMHCPTCLGAPQDSTPDAGDGPSQPLASGGGDLGARRDCGEVRQLGTHLGEGRCLPCWSVAAGRSALEVIRHA